MIEIGQLVLRKKIFFYQCIYAFSYLSSLWKGRGPSFEIWIPFIQGCFVSNFVEIGPVVFEKKMKLWKVYDNANDDANYNEGQRTILLRKAHLSLRLRWALTSFLYFFNHFSSFITTWRRVLGSGSVTTCFYDFGIRTSGLPSTRRTLIKIWLIGPPPRPKGRNKVQTYRKMTIHGWEEKIAEPK